MQVRQAVVASAAGAEVLSASLGALAQIAPQWVLVFADVAWFADAAAIAALRAAFPGAVIGGCSTAGEIEAGGVAEKHCIVTAVHFDGLTVTAHETDVADMDDSHAAGERLGRALAADGARAVMVFAPGVAVNGTALVDGMAAAVGGVPITGGLAGDGGAFVATRTIGPTRDGARLAVAVGLGGKGLRLGHGSFGGWLPFGPARQVTRCAGNVLYELDGEPALAVYKRYLGEHAAGLPASGLLFPFAMLGDDHGAVGLIRTILGIDEDAGSLILAGAIEAGGYLKLMHATADRLVDGAGSAADSAQQMFDGAGETLAVLVSCVGRRLVMGDRVDEEVEAVAEVFGARATLTGFYSYGEISPVMAGGACQLHNQTMTVTLIGED